MRLRKGKHSINKQVEIALLKVPVEEWTPVVLYQNGVIFDGVQRFLIAKKHGQLHKLKKQTG